MSNKTRNNKSKKSNPAILDNENTRKRTSIFVFPFAISLVLSLYLFKGISLTHPRYGTRTLLVAGVILLFWMFAFVIDQWRVYKGQGKVFVKSYILPPFIMALFIGMFIACAAWGAGYLSLVPYERIDNGSQHIDSMFHSAIAESFKHFPYASSLLNGEEYLPYHTFSHMLMGNISRVLGMPALATYCFFFPLIFLPLYLLAILFAVSSVKNYFEGKPNIAFIDIVVVSLFISGVASSSVIGSYGIWKTSYILSESFEIADTLAFLAYGVAFYVMKEWKDDKRRLNIFKYLMVPAFIFIISWSKISVGFVFTASVLFYVFRTRMKEWRYWLLNILYFLVFIVSLRLFNSNVSDSSISDIFRIKAFEEYCSGSLGIWGHYLILLIMPVMFIVLDIARNHYGKKDFLEAGTVWIEDMIVVCFVAFLPGFILIIGGGSAAYFSYVCEIPALLMLCGRNYVDLDEDVKGNMHPIIYTVCFCWCIFTAYTNRSASPLDVISGEHATNLSGTLLEIRDAVGNDAGKYSIYLDQDSIVTQVFTSGMTSSYVCPAMTGVGVINASYYQDGICYSYLGEQLSNAYAMTFTDNEGALSFENAIEKARGMGKEALIHITNSGYEMVDVD